MQFSIEAIGAKELQRDLNKVDAKVRVGIIRAVAKTTYDIDREAKKNVPVHEGQLKNSITPVVRDAQGQVSVRKEYGAGVERGQKPGTWPNVGDLMLWVKRKLKPQKKRLRSVTFLVGRKIFERGTPAQPFFEPAVEKHRKRFHRRIELMLKKL